MHVRSVCACKMCMHMRGMYMWGCVRGVCACEECVYLTSKKTLNTVIVLITELARKYSFFLKTK